MAGDVLGLKVLDKRVEPLVFGNDIESGVGMVGGEAHDVVRNVEVEGVGAGALDTDVLRLRPEGLEFGGSVEWDLVLVGPTEDLGYEGASLKVSQGFGLNVLEVDEDDVRFHGAG